MRTCISKKLLAGALSVMMVLSLVAPTGAQAAAKYSVTGYKTVKAATTRTYTVKGVKKTQYIKVQRNVTGETVKYNNKALTYKTKVKGTGKNLALKVKFSEKKKNYTGKFTVRIYNAKTNKLVKKLVKSVKVKTQVKEEVAVTGVSLDNTTPKVGDTITAKVEPADATNVTYAWYTGAAKDALTDVIADATDSSLTVTEAMVGKFVGVVVKGDNDSTATAASDVAVQAAETEKVQIVSATQKSGTQIEVKFNKKVDTATYSFAVSRGATAQTVETAVAEDGLSAVLTLGAKMGDAEYTIKVTNKNDAEDKAEATLKAEVAVLKELKFQGDNLVIINTEGTMAAVSLKGYDQFGGEVTLTNSNLNLYSSVSSDGVTFDNDTARVIVKVKEAILLQVGAKVTVTAMYNTGTSYVQVATPLTVASRSYVKELTFGDLTTTKAALKNEMVTLKNFASDTYYLPVKTAKDQYDNKLTYKELNAMVAGKLLFMVPSNEMTTYYAVTDAEPFDVLDDGTIILKLKHGTMGKPGTFQVSATSVGGGSFNKEITLVDNPYIDTLNVSVPEVYAGGDFEVTLTGTDQYGKAIDLYDYFDDAKGSGTKKISFGDKNSLTDSSSTLETTGNGTFTYTKNTNKKTVKLVYHAATDKSVIFTVTTAAPKVSTQTITINGKGYAAGIKGLASSVKTSLVKGQQVNFKDLTKVLFLDSYGAVMAADDAYAPHYSADASALNKVPSGYSDAIFTVTPVGNWAKTGSTLTDGVYTAGAHDGSDTVKITLYPVKKDTTGNDFKWDTAVTKTVTLNVLENDDLKYTLTVYDEVLHVGKAGTFVTNPGVDVQLTATDKAGTPVAIGDILTSVTTDLGIDGKVYATNYAWIPYNPDVKEITGKGKTTVSAYVEGVAEPITCELEYSDEASVATYTYLTKYNGLTKKWENVDGAIPAGSVLNLGDQDRIDGEYFIGVADQYGHYIYESKFMDVKTGKYVENGTKTLTTEDNQQYRLSFGSKAQVVTFGAGTITLAGEWDKTSSKNRADQKDKELAALKATAEEKIAALKAANVPMDGTTAKYTSLKDAYTEATSAITDYTEAGGSTSELKTENKAYGDYTAAKDALGEINAAITELKDTLTGEKATIATNNETAKTQFCALYAAGKENYIVSANLAAAEGKTSTVTVSYIDGTTTTITTGSGTYTEENIRGAGTLH